jgi:ATP-binding protein involved in chromosome partitioning
VLGAVENTWPAWRVPTVAQRWMSFRVSRTSASIWAEGVEQLGSIPLDPRVARSRDEGNPLVLSHPESSQAAAFRALADRLARVGA